MRYGIHIDSFSSELSELKKGERTIHNALHVLARHPRVSTWDMETVWVRNLVDDCKRRGYIVDVHEPYPWLKFALTDAGRALIAEGVADV